tara:strand:- start:34186 stop:34896 length:711 start_codon:yes stop_codon:yes gene_type:complete
MSDTKPIHPKISKRAKALARRHHETLWLGSRFLPIRERNRVEAILGLDGELLRIMASVSDPLVGQIRYQWWQDQLEALIANPDETLPGDADLLKLVFRQSGLTQDQIADLISAREDGHLDTGVLAKGHAVLLSLLAGQENETVHAELIEQLAKVYSLTDGKGIPEGLESNLTQAAHNLHRLSDKFWPLVSAFALAPDWLSGRQRSAVMKRWKILRMFLAGEDSLAKRFLQMADQAG